MKCELYWNRLRISKDKKINLLNYTKNDVHHGESIVCFHGLYADSSSFEIIFPYFQDYSIIAIDLPGHGKSKITDDYSPKSLCEKIKKTLDDSGIEKFHLLGHSLGGRVAWKFASMFPEMVSSLAIIDIPLSTRENLAVEKLDEGILYENYFLNSAHAKLIMEHYFGRNMDWVIKNKGISNPRSFSFTFNPLGALKYYREVNKEDLLSIPMDKSLRKIVFRAEVESSLFEKDVEDILKNDPDIRISFVNNAIHTVYQSHPKEFSKLYLNFIKGN